MVRKSDGGKSQAEIPKGSDTTPLPEVADMLRSAIAEFDDYTRNAEDGNNRYSFFLDMAERSEISEALSPQDILEAIRLFRAYMSDYNSRLRAARRLCRDTRREAGVRVYDGILTGVDWYRKDPGTDMLLSSMVRHIKNSGTVPPLSDMKRFQEYLQGSRKAEELIEQYKKNIENMLRLLMEQEPPQARPPPRRRRDDGHGGAGAAAPMGTGKRVRIA